MSHNSEIALSDVTAPIALPV